VLLVLDFRERPENVIRQLRRGRELGSVERRTPIPNGDEVELVGEELHLAYAAVAAFEVRVAKGNPRDRGIVERRREGSAAHAIEVVVSELLGDARADVPPIMAARPH
jgi:hypothetical protein